MFIFLALCKETLLLVKASTTRRYLFYVSKFISKQNKTKLKYVAEKNGLRGGAVG